MTEACKVFVVSRCVVAMMKDPQDENPGCTEPGSLRGKMLGWLSEYFEEWPEMGSKRLPRIEGGASGTWEKLSHR